MLGRNKGNVVLLLNPREAYCFLLVGMSAGRMVCRDLQLPLPAYALVSSEAEETKVSVHMCQTV